MSEVNLAAWLKKKLIPAEEVKVGDFVMGSVGDVFRVGKVEKKDDGIYIYDEDENGGGPEKGKVPIIPREFFAKEPYVY